MNVDLSFLEARSILLAEHRGVQLLQVGCGGTGSHVARAVSQVARVLEDRGSDVRVTFVDPDVVEPKNIPRQLFVDAELGLPKAVALARRYTAAWGVPIDAHQAAFGEAQMAGSDWLRVIVGCVDNAAARKTIAAAVGNARRTSGWQPEGAPLPAPRAWWLDCGNDRQSGQVLLGSTAEPQALAASCRLDGLCTEAPLPTLQAPDLLVARPDEHASAKLSCAELVALDLQALSVNARVAAEAGDMLMRLLITHDLKRFATYFDLPSGTSRSIYCSSAALESFQARQPNRRSRRRRRAA